MDVKMGKSKKERSEANVFISIRLTPFSDFRELFL